MSQPPGLVISSIRHKQAVHVKETKPEAEAAPEVGTPAARGEENGNVPAVFRLTRGCGRTGGGGGAADTRGRSSCCAAPPAQHVLRPGSCAAIIARCTSPSRSAVCRLAFCAVSMPTYAAKACGHMLCVGFEDGQP